MKRARTLPPRNPQGSALVLSMIFIVMFSALAVAMATFSGANVQIAENLQKADATRSCAESGLEVMRYWTSKVEIPGTVAADQRFAQLATSLQGQLTAAGVTNIAPFLSGSTIAISNVPLLSSTGQSFSALLTKIDNSNVQFDVTGHYGSLNRTIRSNFLFVERAHTVFDFGIASKGPLSLTGNVDLDGYSINVESNAYIDCNDLLALSIIGNSMIAGDVKIRNSLANVHMQGHSGVGDVYGAAAMNHIEFGVPPSEFPDMNPAPFIPYATNVLSPTANLSGNTTYENLRIPAGRNPHFTGNLTLNGVIFVETPNVVSFSGNVNITGVIVTNGSSTDNSGTNQITFTGNITCHPITQLPQQPQFQGLQSQTGTFLLAPGFKASFGGNFGTLSGAIAANGIRFYGNAGGVINGSIINYSTAALEMTGNSDLRFNRSGLTQVPAGFVPDTVLNYDRSSYSEVVL
jgi:Tfp pilus assembly protein PilX